MENQVIAHMWFNLAATDNGFGGRSGQEYRNDIARKMTPQQIAEAQKLAAEWKPKTWDELKRQMPK